MLKIKQTGGFFSNCSIKLHATVAFINLYKRLPDCFDCSEQFELYNNNKNNDIILDFFENYNNITNVNITYPIDYDNEYQFIDYSMLNYERLIPLIKKYFTPSVKINEIVINLENKYNIIYDNTLAVYYRGTDKKSETNLAPFEFFYNQILKIININENINILIQTDSGKFLDYINSKNLKNIIVITENKISYTENGIHNEQSSETNYNDMFNFFPTVLIIAKCKYIICSSGNCSKWMMFYRGNAKNTIQYLNGTIYNSIY